MLFTNQYVPSGGYLISQNRLFMGIMQNDGRFCIYHGDSIAKPGPIVSCAPADPKPFAVYNLWMRSDGNLCISIGPAPIPPGAQAQPGPVTCFPAAPRPSGEYFAVMMNSGGFELYPGHGWNPKSNIAYWTMNMVPPPKVATAPTPTQPPRPPAPPTPVKPVGPAATPGGAPATPATPVTPVSPTSPIGTPPTSSPTTPTNTSQSPSTSSQSPASPSSSPTGPIPAGGPASAPTSPTSPNVPPAPPKMVPFNLTMVPPIPPKAPAPAPGGPTMPPPPPPMPTFVTLTAYAVDASGNPDRRFPTLTCGQQCAGGGMYPQGSTIQITSSMPLVRWIGACASDNKAAADKASTTCVLTMGANPTLVSGMMQ
jgi:hypothetical protein